MSETHPVSIRYQNIGEAGIRTKNMRNLARINNYYQREAAIGDWVALALFARREGHAALGIKLRPPTNASVKTIDTAIDALRSELKKLGLDVPENPSASRHIRAT